MCESVWHFSYPICVSCKRFSASLPKRFDISNPQNPSSLILLRLLDEASFYVL